MDKIASYSLALDSHPLWEDEMYKEALIGKLVSRAGSATRKMYMKGSPLGVRKRLNVPTPSEMLHRGREVGRSQGRRQAISEMRKSRINPAVLPQDALLRSRKIKMLQRNAGQLG